MERMYFVGQEAKSSVEITAIVGAANSAKKGKQKN